MYMSTVVYLLEEKKNKLRLSWIYLTRKKN